MPEETIRGSELQENPAPRESPCLRLRCKEMFIDYGTSEPFQLKDSASGIYWCSHTQDCLGPDGEVAHVTFCTAGRGCYEPS